MAKLIKVSETSAYRVSIIRMADDKDKKKFLSIRKMYKTKKEPDEWKPAYQGLTIPLDITARILRACVSVFKNRDEEKIEIIPKKEKK